MQHTVFRRVIVNGLIGIVVLGWLAGMAFLIRPYLPQRPADADSPVDSTPSLQEPLLEAAPQAAMLTDAGTLRPIETEFIDWSYPDGVSLERGHLIDETASDAEGVVARTKLGARRRGRDVHPLDLQRVARGHS